MTILLFTFLSVLLLNTPALAFNEAHLKKLQAVGSCPECDLSKADLSGADLTRANLSQGYLGGADLSGANLDSAIKCKTIFPWGEDNSGCK